MILTAINAALMYYNAEKLGQARLPLQFHHKFRIVVVGIADLLLIAIIVKLIELYYV